MTLCKGIAPGLVWYGLRDALRGWNPGGWGGRPRGAGTDAAGPGIGGPIRVLNDVAAKG